MAPDTGPCCSRWTHYCPYSCCSPGLEVATGSPCCFASLPLRSKARAGAPDSWCMAYSHTLPQQQGGWGSLMSAGITQMGVRFNVLLRLIRWRITKQQETSKKKKDMIYPSSSNKIQSFPQVNCSYLAEIHISDFQVLCTIRVGPAVQQTLFHLASSFASSEEQRAAGRVCQPLAFFKDRKEGS